MKGCELMHFIEKSLPSLKISIELKQFIKGYFKVQEALFDNAHMIRLLMEDPYKDEFPH